jgi:hypothetical protein
MRHQRHSILLVLALRQAVAVVDAAMLQQAGTVGTSAQGWAGRQAGRVEQA